MKRSLMAEKELFEPGVDGLGGVLLAEVGEAV